MRIGQGDRQLSPLAIPGGWPAHGQNPSLLRKETLGFFDELVGQFLEKRYQPSAISGNLSRWN
jgi:hypothetical protein